MAKRKNHIIKPEDYQKYLLDKMTPEERHEFERHLLENDFEDEALEGLAEFSPVEVAEDLRELKTSLASRTKKTSTLVVWRVAAALVLLGLFSFLTYYFIDQGTLEKERTLTKSDTPEATKSERALPDQFSEESDSIEMLAYQQELKVAEPVLDEEEDPSYSVQTLPKAGKGEESQVVGPGQLQEDLELAISLDEQREIEVPSTTALGLNAGNEEELNKMESKPIAEEISSPAAARTQDAENFRASSMAEKKTIRTIIGEVRAKENNEVVPGVNVFLKGSSIGTITDLDGNYTIDIPLDEEATLVFSFIGLVTREMPVNNQDNIDVIMESNNEELAEVVVARHGRQKKKNRSGAKSSFEAEKSQERSYIQPQPKGGSRAFKDFVRENLRYPVSGVDEGVKGTVVLKFKVGVQGQISEMEVVKSLGKDFDEEAIRLVNDGPAWEPAMEKGQSIVRYVNVKIRFKPPS